jgi:hypothetical protein
MISFGRNLLIWSPTYLGNTYKMIIVISKAGRFTEALGNLDSMIGLST